MDITEEVLLAEQRIRPYIRETPLEKSLYLSKLVQGQVFLKLENLQYTGSFKVRGAMNKLLALSSEQRKRGVVAASSGNHGIAVAFGLHQLDAPGTIFVPNSASPTKVDTIRLYGADVRFHGNDCGVTEQYARAYATKNNMVYISPYNDPQVIGGQGTLAIELCRQMQNIDAVLVALGGGGMIAGIASYLKSIFTSARVIGCSPVNSPVMAESVKAHKIVNMESKPTLSDGTAGGIEPNAITFPLCEELVDDYILVSEEEIRDAMRLFIETHHSLIEGAAGVVVASLLKNSTWFKSKNVVLILCGANIGKDDLKLVFCDL